MPLIKSSSDAAFKSNLKAELNANRPKNQALAIAYRIKRDAKKRKYADGGAIPDDPFERAAMRQQISVGQRHEGVPTKVLDAIGSSLYQTATLPKRLVEAAGQHPPGMSLRENPELVQMGAETAFSLLGAPGLAGGVPGVGMGLRRLPERTFNVALDQPIRAYHGSPYDFDRFDLSKIGTGEGAQTYGHGLYFAENPKVAESYKNDPTMLQSRQLFKDWTPIHEDAASRVHEVHGDVNAAIANLTDRIRNSRMYGDSPESLVGLKSELSLLESGWKPPLGRMYEVNINARPEQFLDWDRPLREQQHLLPNLSEAGVTPKNIEPIDADRLAKLGEWGQAQNKYLTDVGSKPGSTVYMDAGLRVGGYGRDYGKAATPALLDAGIPGIKYLDQGSRGAGSGTSNYVVFDDKLIDILRKYAIPGMMGAGALQQMNDGKANGGTVDHALKVSAAIKRQKRAAGGANISTPWFARNEARGMLHSGPIKSIVPGRTDNHGMRVAAGSYVVPSQAVSHLGQNNTDAGMAILGKMFSAGPYGAGGMKISRGRGAPKLKADGGAIEDDTEPVEVLTAGGEYVIPPEMVREIGGGDIKLGHKILDAWVIKIQKEHAKTIKNLPAPAKK